MTENNEKLHEIPKSWKWSTLGEISTIYSGGTPSTKDETNFGGDIPWITPADLSDHTDVYIRHGQRNITEKGLHSSSAIMIPAGSVLLSSRAPIGYVVIATNDVATNQGMKSFHLFDGISNEYVYYYLKGNKSLLESHASGTTFLEVSKTRVSRVPIPIPTLPEQERIVAKIEELFTQLEAGVAELVQAKAQLQRYRQAVLKSAVEGELTRAWREAHQSELEPAEKLLARILSERRAKWEEEELEKLRAKGKEPKNDKWKTKYKEPAQPDTEDLPDLPEGWEWATLDQLCPRFVDSAHRTPRYGTKGYPALGPRDVVGGKLNLENARVVDDDEFNIQTSRHVPEKGDIVYSRELSFGWAVEIPNNVKLCLSQGMCLFRTHPKIDNRYFISLLNGNFGRRQAEKAATGSAHPHINLGDIKAYVFPVPPLEEQKIIAAKVERRLSVADEIEKELDQALTRSERLRQSILKRAFEGKLVRQEEGD